MDVDKISEASKIPHTIYGNILPLYNLSVADLRNFQTPPTQNPPTLQAIDSLFSKEHPSINESTSRILLVQPMPALTDVDTLLNYTAKAEADGYLSIIYPVTRDNESVNMMLPIWIIPFWKEAYVVLEAKTAWKACWEWSLPRIRKIGVPSKGPSFSQVPWSYTLTPKNLGFTHGMWRYCGDTWLGDEQMNQMLAVLERELASDTSTELNSDVICDVYWLNKLIRIHRYTKDTYPNHPEHRLYVEAGAKIHNCEYTRLGAPVFLSMEGGQTVLPNPQERGNHWATVLIDLGSRTIKYGDAMGFAPPAELVSALSWWLAQHWEGSFELTKLYCTPQTDSNSCALLSFNGLAAELLPHTFPLIEPGCCDVGRIQMFERLVTLMKENVSSYVFYNPSNSGLHFFGRIQISYAPRRKRGAQ